MCKPGYLLRGVKRLTPLTFPGAMPSGQAGNDWKENMCKPEYVLKVCAKQSIYLKFVQHRVCTSNVCKPEYVLKTIANQSMYLECVQNRVCT